MKPFLVLIQARTGSSRLPGKVMMPLLGKTVLERMWERVTAARVPAQFGMIITQEASDDPIAELCEDLRILCYRGSTQDVLDRHYQAWRLWGGQAVVKIPSDCPLIDPKIIERVLNFYTEHVGQFDYVSNLHPQSYPDGNDVEVMSAGALERAWKEAKEPFQREHTTPYLWDNPAQFRIGNVLAETGDDLSQSHRWTLDYLEDYKLIKAVFEELYPHDPLFGVEAIVNLVDSRPELKALNDQHRGYIWYNQHKEQLKTLIKEMRQTT